MMFLLFEGFARQNVAEGSTQVLEAIADNNRQRTASLGGNSLNLSMRLVRIDVVNRK